MALQLQPIDMATAFAFVDGVHRHHRAPQGWKVGIGVNDGVKLVGVVIVGRPVARHLQDGLTLEVTRLATDGTKNACSILYGAARRAAFALGYQRIITYILAEELGSSLKAAGWQLVKDNAGGGKWDRPSRPANDNHPLGKKQRWEALDGRHTGTVFVIQSTNNDQMTFLW